MCALITHCLIVTHLTLPVTAATGQYLGPGLESPTPDPAAAFLRDKRLIAALRDADLCTYSVGAPKCGSQAFCKVRQRIYLLHYTVLCTYAKMCFLILYYNVLRCAVLCYAISYHHHLQPLPSLHHSTPPSLPLCISLSHYFSFPPSLTPSLSRCSTA